MRNTPGAAGYLLAWVVSVAAFSGLVIGWLVLETYGNDPGSLLIGWCYLCVFTAVYSVPFAAVGLPLVHIACRRVRPQWVHVAAAGLAGALPMVTFGVTSGGWGVLGSAVVPVATAIGRWSVVPLVERRRREAPFLVGVA